jgi:hypothetical protein
MTQYLALALAGTLDFGYEPVRNILLPGSYLLYFRHILTMEIVVLNSHQKSTGGLNEYLINFSSATKSDL